MRRNALATLLVLGLATPPIVAQEHPAVERGFGAGSFQVSELDQVNLLNGALTWGLGIGPGYPVNGSMSYRLRLSYTSKVYDYEEIAVGEGFTAVRSMPAQHANAGMGWLLSLGGRLIDPSDPSNETGRWQLLDRQGGRSSFFSTLHPTDGSEAGFSYSRDGRYLRMHVIAGGKRTVEYPDGEIHTFSAAGRLESMADRFGNTVTVAYPNASTWVISDGHRSHTVNFKTLLSDGQAVQVVDTVELAGFEGSTSTYRFEHESAMIEPACSDTFRAEGSRIQVPFLKRIVLPGDGGTFEFEYRTNGCDGGLLELVTLPDRGQIDYNYTSWELPTAGCDAAGPIPWAQLTPGISRRALIDPSGTVLGAWQYHQSLLGPPAEPTGLCQGTDEDPSEVSQTSVISPDGDETRHYFSVWPSGLPMGGSPNGFQVEEYGLPFDRTRTDATGNRYLSTEIIDDGVLKRSIYVRYEYEKPCIGTSTSQICDESNRRLASQRTVFHDDGNRIADVTFSDHDGLGHYRTVTTGGDYPAGNVRTTFTNYNPGHDLVLGANLVPQPGYVMWPTSDPWVLGTFSEQTVTEGGQTAKVQTCFDSDTGFELRRRTMVGTEPGNNDVIDRFTDDGNGNVRFEESFGGDTQTVAMVSNLCGMTLPSTPRYKLSHNYSSGVLANSRYLEADETSVGFLLVDQTIDASTGLAAASRDSAGIATAYEYDALGRLLWEKPEAGHGAWIEYVHDRATLAAPAAVRIRHRENGSETGTILSQEEIQFDGFGRVAKERRLMPSLGWSVRETDYDAQGRTTEVSEWAAEAAVPFVQHWTRFQNYDAFNRVGRITPPDGAAHDVLFAYTGDRVVRRTVQVATAFGSESASTTVERYDRQGRLLQVVEPSGDGGAFVTTDYGYDEGNRLVQVSTTADSVTQIRRFTYDNRGFLLSESHPEKSGLVTYTDYDARGRAGRKIDGESNLAFTYDRAERVTAIAEGNGPGRPLKSFEYSKLNAAGDRRKGKLRKATRYNYYVVEAPQPFEVIFEDGFECGDTSAWNGGGGCTPPELITYDVEVEETYVYGGIGGRVSQRDTAITLNGNTGETFTQGWSYTELGDVDTVTYPTCTFSRCTADGAGAPRTVTTNYVRGYPTNVLGYATISYHPNNLYAAINHSNGVVVTQAADPNGLARPASITAAKDSNVHWTTGTYAYDGGGNVSAVGGASFLYDKVSRLVTGVVSTDRLSSGSLVRQDYVFDAFGNLQEIVGSPGRLTPTSSATNRLQGSATYSAAGNLRSWNGITYEYDAFHMMTRMIAGPENWLYVYTADDERIWQFQISASEPPSHRYTLRDLSGQVLREYSSNNDFWAIERDYVYRSGQLLAAETPEGERHFHLDHLGTPRLITGPSGGRVAYHVYFPFGEEATDPLQDQERMKFTGHERDLADLSGTGDDLDYMHARFCSPVTGRFTSVDPTMASFRAEAPQTHNRYSYVLNSPMNFVDPTGEVLDTLADIGFIVYDVVDIIKTVASGEGVTGTQVAALGGDVLGAVVPFATGVGAGVRAASKADDVVDAVRALDKAASTGDVATTAARVPNPGGKLGNPATRAQVDEVATEMKNRGFEITGGGGQLPEEFIRGAGPGTKGSAFPDITATKNGRTVRVNTVDTLKDGVTPTARERRNAARIRSLQSGDHLLLIPKKRKR